MSADLEDFWDDIRPQRKLYQPPAKRTAWVGFVGINTPEDRVEVQLPDEMVVPLTIKVDYAVKSDFLVRSIEFYLSRTGGMPVHTMKFDSGKEYHLMPGDSFSLTVNFTTSHPLLSAPLIGVTTDNPLLNAFR